MMSADLNLVVRKIIPATPDRVFRAWTHAKALEKWWGPEGVTCHAAMIDLTVGGKYSIGNTLPDGQIIWITGEFKEIETNQKLVYSWKTDLDGSDHEKVTVRFNEVRLASNQTATEVVVIHEHIATEQLKTQHAHGWGGCLFGLVEFNFG